MENSIKTAKQFIAKKDSTEGEAWSDDPDNLSKAFVEYAHQVYLSLTTRDV